jgi:GTPase SAR1 family protein
MYLRDTAGQETYSHLRTLSYGQADIFLIVFSVTDPNSFQNAVNKVPYNHQSKWYKELSEEDLARVPKMFIGNKIDLRSPSDETHIQKESVPLHKSIN